VPDADCHIIFDAHMRSLTENSLEMLARTAIESEAVVCGTTWMMNHPAPGKNDFPRNGGRFTWEPVTPVKNDKNQLGLRLQWSYTRDEEIQPVDAILGASYAMTWETWHKLGGWQDTPGAYGFGEQSISIRAWFMDIPVLCCTKAHFKHKFRVERPYAMSGVPYWHNFVWCSKIIWRDDIFRRVFLPVAQRIFPGDRRIVELAESPAAEKLRDEFQAKKHHSDEEALKWLKIE